MRKITLNPSHLWSLIVTCLILIRIILMQGWEDAVAMTIGLTVILAMIWFNGFWAKYILPFGWLASKANDFKKAEYSAPAIALIGWVLLLLILYLAYFRME